MKMPQAFSLEPLMTALPSNIHDENHEVIFIRKKAS